MKFIVYFFFLLIPGQLFLPISVKDRKDFSKIQLTAIGSFGLMRKERKTVREHLHTGIDIKRPNNNYASEPIFPLSNGKVISKRTDGAYAQLMIEHENGSKKFWTIYEHISGIQVKVNDKVDTDHPIARFMNREELNKLGWQFDHFHLEVLKVKPYALIPDKNHPERFYSSYSLICFTKQDLGKYYYDPMEFIKNNL